MANLRNATIGLLAGGFLCVGATSNADAQEQAAARIDLDSVAQELELTEEAKRELAPQLEALNEALQHRWEHWQEGIQLRQQFDDAYDEIANTLTAAQLREFSWHLRRAAYGVDTLRPYPGIMRRGVRGDFRRGMPMRGMRGTVRQGGRMRSRWDVGPRGWPGWRPDDSDPND